MVTDRPIARQNRCYQEATALLTGHESERPARTYFAIVTMGRSGSTFFERLLNSHPRIICLGEVFAPAGPFADAAANHPTAAISGPMFGDAAGVLGFKLPWENLTNAPALRDALRELDFRLVRLWRRNKLDHYLSISLARLNDHWSPQDEYATQSIVLEPRATRDAFSSCTVTDERVRILCRQFPHVSVTYEDLIRGKGQTEVQAFLGVDPLALASGITRARRVPRRQAILNFDELRAYFAGSPWAWYFDDDEHLIEG